MRSFCLVVACFFLFLTDHTAQLKQDFNYDSLLIYLDRSLQTGHKRSLRDLASLLDRKELHKKVLQILKNRSLFTKKEFNWDRKLSKQDFLDFYYDHETQFNYSDLYDAFYLSAPEAQDLKFEISKTEEKLGQDQATLLRLYAEELDQFIQQNKAKKALKQLDKIDALNIQEAKQYLVELSQNTAWLKQHPEFARQICLYLQDFPRIETVDQILYLLHDQVISGELADQVLKRLTNLSVCDDGNYAKLGQRYRYYLDSLGTLDDLRNFGYEKALNLKLNFFPFPVDFYGRVLSKCPLDQYEWVRHNALLDILNTQNPKSLYYIATQLYKFRNQPETKQKEFVELIQAITKVEVMLLDDQGNKHKLDFPKKLSDKLAYVNYWGKHYNDYNWENTRQLFVNKKEAIEKTENYERLFRRLNSKNDTIALASYQKLTEGDPAGIIELTAKYRQLLRNYNKKLPNFKYFYLEELVKLTEYCRKNQINYQTPKRLQKLLHKLLQKQAPKERYQLENKLIEAVKLDEITAIEYWACIHSKNRAADFSIGRILDWFYSKHWQKIITDDQQLRLFLKKSYLFENIGVVGTGSAYLNKLDVANPLLQEKLSYLLRIESDEAIANQISRIISDSEEESGPTVGLDDFLEDPSSYNKRDLNILAAPTEQELKRIIKTIKEEFDPNNIKTFFSYLRLHASLSMVPHLFQLKDDQRVLSKKRGKDIRVVDFMISIVEGIFDYSFPVNDPNQFFASDTWIELWEKEGKNYQNWQKKFFEEKLTAFRHQEELDIDDINLITSSPYYTEDYKQICLEALKKVQEVKTIRQLNIEPKLSLKEDLPYFESFNFSYKELDDIPKLFQIDQDEELMLAFLKRKSSEFSLEERGSFFNNLFQTPWLSNYIHKIEQANDFTNHISAVLNKYLDESDYISEYEEQITMLHLAQIKNIGKTLEEKLQSSIEMDADANSKTKIQQEIIAVISYEEISTVFKFIDKLSFQIGTSPYAFLNKDFGLPIFDLDNYADEKTLVANHQKMTEKEFYLHYITAFGVDFLNNNKSLDYQKIYDILSYDVTTPFIGSSGGKRDYYIFGIIKLLEIEFNDRLGFHRKLNNAQTFYSISSIKRAEAWKQYLLDNNLVEEKLSLPPSFNQVKAEY